MQTPFVANDAAAYAPTVGADPSFQDAWGIAIRPAGIPGHFWVLAGNKSYEYVGDVTGKTVAPCTTPGALCADLAPLDRQHGHLPRLPARSRHRQPGHRQQPRHRRRVQRHGRELRDHADAVGPQHQH